MKAAMRGDAADALMTTGRSGLLRLPVAATSSSCAPGSCREGGREEVVASALKRTLLWSFDVLPVKKRPCYLKGGEGGKYLLALPHTASGSSCNTHLAPRKTALLPSGREGRSSCPARAAHHWAARRSLPRRRLCRRQTSVGRAAPPAAACRWCRLAAWPAARRRP